MRNCGNQKRNTECRLVVRSNLGFNGVKVFTASRHYPRIQLGDKITEWLASHPTISPVEFVVRQSSDAGYHCLAIIVMYNEPVVC